jgi:hypothetical protein
MSKIAIGENNNRHVDVTWVADETVGDRGREGERSSLAGRCDYVDLNTQLLYSAHTRTHTHTHTHTHAHTHKHLTNINTRAQPC